MFESSDDAQQLKVLYSVPTATVARKRLGKHRENLSKTAEEQTLRREVGWYGSFAMGYADVGADIYVAIGLVALFAGGASPLAFLIASITYITTGLAYSELATTYPYAGGAHIYAMKAFNDLAGFIAGWAVMLDYTVDIALFSLASAGYLSFFFPGITTGHFVVGMFGIALVIPDLGLIAAALITVLLIVNIIGIRESSLFNEILVSFDIFVEAIILVFGFVLAFSLARFLGQVGVLGSPLPHLNIAYSLPSLGVQDQNFIYGITLAMTSFIGIESIAQAAEETRRPDKWIPRANKLSIISVVVFAVGLSALSLGLMGWQELAAARNDPISAIAAHIPVVGVYLAPIVAITGFAICYVSTNTGVIGVSRIVFSMGRFDLLPRWFYKVHPRFRTPFRTILVFGIIGLGMALVGELTFVADLYNYGALLSYIIVNVCLIVLRNKEPSAFRAWKVPGSLTLTLRGREIIVPIISVFGAISCAALWSLILTFHEGGRILGTAWVLVGIVGFVILRRIKHMPVLTSETGKRILPGGYVMNAAVLVRTPEDERRVVSSIRESLDKRFHITLLSIVDPADLGLSADNLNDYKQISDYRDKSVEELQWIAKKLRSVGYEAEPRVEIGPFIEILDEEAKADRNDVVVLIKRRTLRGHIEKERSDSSLAVLSKYPGKVMIVRRSS
jgi:basic amino acid/polyamine antiporter, APA family